MYTSIDQQRSKKEINMSKFKRMRNFREVIRNCDAKGFKVHRNEFNNSGSDWIWITELDNRQVRIKYNVYNGRFFVFQESHHPDNCWATESSNNLDDNELYREIFYMFYKKDIPDTSPTA